MNENESSPSTFSALDTGHDHLHTISAEPIAAAPTGAAAANPIEPLDPVADAAAKAADAAAAKAAAVNEAAAAGTTVTGGDTATASEAAAATAAGDTAAHAASAEIVAEANHQHHGARSVGHGSISPIGPSASPLLVELEAQGGIGYAYDIPYNHAGGGEVTAHGSTALPPAVEYDRGTYGFDKDLNYSSAEAAADEQYHYAAQHQHPEAGASAGSTIASDPVLADQQQHAEAHCIEPVVVDSYSNSNVVSSTTAASGVGWWGSDWHWSHLADNHNSGGTDLSATPYTTDVQATETAGAQLQHSWFQHWFVY